MSELLSSKRRDLLNAPEMNMIISVTSECKETGSTLPWKHVSYLGTVLSLVFT